MTEDPRPQDPCGECTECLDRNDCMAPKSDLKILEEPEEEQKPEPPRNGCKVKGEQNLQINAETCSTTYSTTYSIELTATGSGLMGQLFCLLKAVQDSLNRVIRKAVEETRAQIDPNFKPLDAGMDAKTALRVYMMLFVPNGIERETILEEQETDHA